MITPIYKICPACHGEGSIESLDWPSSSVAGTRNITMIECIACKGLGYIPTGDFLIEQQTIHFKEELQALPENFKNTIIRKL